MNIESKDNEIIIKMTKDEVVDLHEEISSLTEDEDMRLEYNGFVSMIEFVNILKESI